MLITMRMEATIILYEPTRLIVGCMVVVPHSRNTTNHNYDHSNPELQFQDPFMRFQNCSGVNNSPRRKPVYVVL